METITKSSIDSTGYRSLFQCAKEIGIDKVMNFVDEINGKNFNKEVLLRQAILYGKNNLLSFVIRNKDVVQYFRDHEEDFRLFKITDTNVFDVLVALEGNISRLDLYLENAKRLETLGVSKIKFGSLWPISVHSCKLYRNKDGQITFIQKDYTDGKLLSVGNEVLDNETYYYSQIPYQMDNGNATFCLTSKNSEHGFQTRWIEIEDFGFRGDKLPSKEDIDSYEIPKQLIKR